uniref:Uncharacterized protein n=1 Tax=Lepeophtheirus salmonis TaxID=72036 RepID=A0A0K2UTH8_LEPSM
MIPCVFLPPVSSHAFFSTILSTNRLLVGEQSAH